MKSLPAVDEVRHIAFEAVDGLPILEARVSDRQRLGILLQGIALMAVLDEAGWRLPYGWAAARVSRNGLLRVPEAVPGTRIGLPQERMRDLVRSLFGPSEQIHGRGQARRIVRVMLESWRQSLTPVAPNQALDRLLLEAPILWDPAFGGDRTALLASFRRGGSWSLWCAGAQAFRTSLLASATAWDEAAVVLAGPEARRLDGASRRSSAGAVAAEEPWPSALEHPELSPESKPGSRLTLARALFSRGQFGRALEALAKARTLDARILRARCQLWLHEYKAAGAGLRKIEKLVEIPSRVVEASEVAVDVFTKLSDFGQQQVWASRALAASEEAEDAEEGSYLFARAQLIAASAASDRGDQEALAHHLGLAEQTLEKPGWDQRPGEHRDLERRWLRVRALQSMAAGDGEGTVQHLSRILRHHRRELKRFEAAVLWNDLGIGRAQLGDLPAAERAFLHAQRLMERCEGPKRESLALFNLAEIRLRRGRLVGVREALERSTESDRRAGDQQALEYDDELWARYELVLGRPTAALRYLRQARSRIAENRLEHRRQEVAVLEARALGLLGRPGEAAAKLKEVSAGALATLEPEERPAVFALAGLRQEALATAAGSELESWWFGVLAGGDLNAGQWDQLDRLERYRAARLVHDAELLHHGCAPPRWRRRAAEAFYRVGATGQAQILESRDRGPWKILERYLAKSSLTTADVGAIFSEVGYTDAGLIWRPQGGGELLLWGAGDGQQELVEDLSGGLLILRCHALDPVVRALFRLAIRSFQPPQRAALPAPAGGMLGESAKLMDVLERLKKLARAEVPVLVLGESGTGKELAARNLHRQSDRKDGPFVPLNCAALSEHLVLSDLFGHVKGSFTGADRDRAGVFETARGGTVFLDEVGDLPLSAQGNLLRVLQESEVRRLGESLSRTVDVRVVAATHRDLAAMVEDKSFRQDLYYRLRVGSLSLPPLRERGRDVELLAESFLAKERPGCALSSKARALLLSHSWPGNVRELHNVLSLAIALADGEVIDAEHLDIPKVSLEETTDYHANLRAFRLQMIGDALEAASGNQAEAARRVGLTRQALAYQIKQLGLE